MNERLAHSTNWHLVCFIVSVDTSDPVHNTSVHYMRCENTKQAFTAGQQTQTHRSSEGGYETQELSAVSLVIVPKAAASFHPIIDPLSVPLRNHPAWPAKPLEKETPCLKRLAAVGRVFSTDIKCSLLCIVIEDNEGDIYQNNNLRGNKPYLTIKNSSHWKSILCVDKYSHCWCHKRINAVLNNLLIIIKKQNIHLTNHTKWIVNESIAWDIYF